MSIAQELDRIMNAKGGIKAAIETRGVTVPPSALISDYPPLLDSLPIPHWLGENAEDLGDVYSRSYALSETEYATWTPSTTAKVIIASENAGTFHAALSDYEYWIRWQFVADWAHSSGQTMKAVPELQAHSLWQTIHKRPYGFAEFISGHDSRNYCVTAFTASSYIFYYNASGTHTWNTGISYGLYPGATAATFSSNTSDTPTVTIKTPTVSVRCSSTYFATTRGANVDQANTTIKIKGTLFRVKRDTSCVRKFYLDAIDLLNNPL